MKYHRCIKCGRLYVGMPINSGVCGAFVGFKTVYVDATDVLGQEVPIGCAGVLEEISEEEALEEVERRR